MNSHRLLPAARTVFRLAALAAAWAACGAAHAIEYAELDRASDATTGVLVQQLGSASASAPAALLTATYARWDTGRAIAVGAVQRWALATGAQQVSFGVGAGVHRYTNDNDASQDKTALALRAQLEAQGPAAGGRYYALVQGSSFRGAWLATAQFTPGGGPLSVEAGRYSERGYRATNVGLRVALGETRWSLRGGASRADDKTHGYVGVAYNGF